MQTLIRGLDTLSETLVCSDSGLLLLRTFPGLLLLRTVPALFKTRCKFLCNSMMYTLLLLSIVSISFLLTTVYWNLVKLLLKSEIIYLFVTRVFFYNEFFQPKMKVKLVAKHVIHSNRKKSFSTCLCHFSSLKAFEILQCVHNKTMAGGWDDGQDGRVGCCWF